MIPLDSISDIRSIGRATVVTNEQAFELHSKMAPKANEESLMLAWDSRIRKLYGSRQREVLEAWIVDTFHTLQGDNWDWLLFKVLLIQWSAKLRHHQADEFQLPQPERAQSLFEEMYRLPTSDLETRLQRRRSSPLSDWDAPLFQRLGLTIDAHHSEELIDALGYIREPAQFNFFRRFWRLFVPLLGPHSERTIHVLAQDLANREFSWPVNRVITTPSSLSPPYWYLTASRLRNESIPGQTQWE